MYMNINLYLFILSVFLENPNIPANLETPKHV